MTLDKPSRLDRLYKSMVVIALSLLAIVLFKDIIVPIAFAALFAIVLNPIAVRIERFAGTILSILIVLLGTFIIMFLGVWFVVDQITSLIDSLPGLEDKFFGMLMEASTQIHTRLGISTEEQVTMLTDGAKDLSAHVGGVLLSTTYLAYFFVQVPIYIFLFLLYRAKFHDFFQAYSSSSDMKWEKEVEGVVRGYISGLAIVVLIAGAINSIGLMVLGIEHAIFFGFLSGALTLIPYIGITIGATLPAFFALVTKDSAWYAVGVVALHGTVQFLEGNFITPRVTGKKISINPLAAILALLMGGTILGIAGMIIAVPVVGVLKILLAGSSDLKPFVILLEDKRAYPPRAQEHPDQATTNVSSPVS